MEAGKHVLCEKPIALNASEADRLLSETNILPHLKVMEAFMYRFHPQWKKSKDLVAQGDIGDLESDAVNNIVMDAMFRSNAEKKPVSL